MSAARFEPMEVEDGESCTVCMSRPRTVRNQPCGYATLCELCTIKMIKSRTIDCPLSRTFATLLEFLQAVQDSDSEGGHALVPNGVIALEGGAFYECSTLTSITLPDSLTAIGDEAFNGCDYLTAVTLPDSLASISERAFGGCSALTSLTLPDSLTSIGVAAFNGCAFFRCSALTAVTLPDGLTTIGNEAFRDCPLDAESAAALRASNPRAV
ncbi:hypothetical protein EMIHUDRAFT_214613 [Emiliania huxleyi CCMP1516]|uniref:RING-type domain-containing protein n=2 Tax=Emiliania huxleyi TaxID=2903 RepID=A0A0D3IJ77_EMIH1|nr:hypothetical protein EMIHUDRAFT_214613 [Emiliania huxleyi CCMP1516]EOD11312.1 hypothetical protein EMIHUDRAFT_214613 [Emiliania huxleyi CCMP1516]|eukprot:XP_005763741.1 hypothetical protein EMIHUDRAFT_214613 [Emiliania huxleyi CCMP1516]